MPCYHPLTAYRTRQGRLSSGKWPVTFNQREGYNDKEVKLPCGQCIGCRLERSKVWAMRCMCEASLHDQNCFITLTYEKEPENFSLSIGPQSDVVLFIKRLRKHIGKRKIRFFQCGEYGEKLQRPHHHAIIFGYDFPDKELYSQERGVTLWESPLLFSLWQHGFCTVGSVNFDSAAYVARYITKKITGKGAESFYQGRNPEYITMSRKPGIGKEWFTKYKNDVLSIDGVMIKPGIKVKPGKYFDGIYDLENHSRMERIKRIRVKKINPADNTYERLAVRKELTYLNMKTFKRSYENGNNKNLLTSRRKSI